MPALLSPTCNWAPTTTRRSPVYRGIGCAAWFTLLCTALFAQLAAAEDDHVLARKLRDAGEILPLEQILKRARAARPGEVIETELKRKKSHYVYKVEILDKTGQVWEMKFDARTGDLIKMERDD